MRRRTLRSHKEDEGSSTDKKNVGGAIDRDMNTSFTAFLLRRVSLHEVSEYFPVSAMNDLFVKELNLILAREELDDATREDLERLRSLNLVAYVDSSTRRAGIGEGERDEVVHDLLVRLLVSPGSLFAKWDRKSPMTARLKVAIKNSLISAAKARQNRAKRFQDLPDTVASRQCDDDPSVIERFRDELRRRLGDAAVKVFDTRLNGEDIKSLIGSEGMSSYRLKQLVQRIKEVARGFGDDCLQSMVSKMSVQESETLAKRFGRHEPVSARP